MSKAVLTMIDLDPNSVADTHGPLDFAPAPHSLARSVLPADVIDGHLDALQARQKPDGGRRSPAPNGEAGSR